MSDPSAPDPLAALSSPEATPRPWKVTKHERHLFALVTLNPPPEWDGGCFGMLHLESDDATDEATADLILACVNAFAALDATVIDRIRAGGGLAASVRDLEAALKRAEGVAVSALAKLEADGRRYAQLVLEANAETMVAENRVAALEAALRRAGERLHSALMGDTTMTVHACHTFEATDTLSACPAYECVDARAALAPPERSRVAAPPEPPGADDDPGGA